MSLNAPEPLKLPTEGLRSKIWDEFGAPSSPHLDFVFTVCDNAAGEACPYWPGQPMTAHWGLEDPAAVEGSETEKWLAFRKTFNQLESRIKLFTSLPLASLDKIRLQEHLDAIGKTRTENPWARRTPGIDTQTTLNKQAPRLLVIRATKCDSLRHFASVAHALARPGDSHECAFSSPLRVVLRPACSDDVDLVWNCRTTE
jgi:hypothetical protein